MFDYHLFKKLSAMGKNCQSNSFVLNEAASRLIDRLLFIRLKPQRVFLEGVFTQKQKEEICRHFKIERLDERLSFDSDIIISNCQLHRHENIHQRLSDYHRYLRPGGMLLFSSFGSSTLAEFAKAWGRADGMAHINQMLDMHDLGDMLLKNQFSNAVVDGEIMRLQYDHIQRLVQDIRDIDEPLADTRMRKTLTGKGRWQTFCQRLEKTGMSIGYELVYGYGERPAQLRAKSGEDGTATITLESLKSQLKHRDDESE
ncbi:MAG: hypothetical protein ACO2ZM_01800 [Francisellaceae bacterium]